MQEKMIGKIKWFKQNKGYGYIIGADDETYFFQITNCINKNDIFETNDDVLFIPNFDTVDYADKIEKIK